MPFPQAPVGARRILSKDYLWCCGRSCWWCSRRMNKRSSPSGSGRGRSGASERRVQSRSTLSEAKPGYLWTCWPEPSPAATPRVCHRPTDHIYQPLRSGRIWHKVKAGFNRFEFRVFLLLDELLHQGWRTQSALLFTHNWRENNWIHTFPKGISVMWNAIGLVQDLNSYHRVHFLRR